MQWNKMELCMLSTSARKTFQILEMVLCFAHFGLVVVLENMRTATPLNEGELS
jgi:hypothetical protein